MINISVNNISKSYFINKNEVPALKNISFEVHGGESFGIIGANGSGKTTLLKLLCGNLKPTSGEVLYNGNISSLIDLGWSVHPQLSGNENILIAAGLLGVSRQEARQKISQIGVYAGLNEEILNRPLHTYSSGMYLKLAFSIMMTWPRSILLFDELLAVGDAGFSMKVFETLARLKQQGHTIIFASHNLNQVHRYSDRVMVLQNGSNVFTGMPGEALNVYYNLTARKHVTNSQTLDEFNINHITVIGRQLPDGCYHADDELKIIVEFELNQQNDRLDICFLFEDISGEKLFGDDTLDWPVEAVSGKFAIEWKIPPQIINGGKFAIQLIGCKNHRIAGNLRVIHLEIASSAPIRAASMLDTRFYLKGALKPLNEKAFPVPERTEVIQVQV